MPTAAINTPSRNPQAKAGCGRRWRRSKTAVSKLSSQSTTIAIDIAPQIAASKGVATLKWLVVPRSTWPMMAINSTTAASAVPQETRATNRRCPST